MQNVTRNGIAFLGVLLIIIWTIWSQLPKEK